jgi:Transposase/Alcohol dehydrogenase GroES-like domain
MKNSSQHLIAEVPRRRSRVEMTIGVDLGDVWSHYCTLNPDGEVVDRGRFRNTPKAIAKWFTDLPSARVAMKAGVHSIWISEQLQELGHEVIVANVPELRAISHSDRKSNQVDAEKLARYARLERRAMGPKDVLLDTLYCGVCHTDIHIVRGEWGPAHYPCVPGHTFLMVKTDQGCHIITEEVERVKGLSNSARSSRNAMHDGHDLWLKVIKERSEKQN